MRQTAISVFSALLILATLLALTASPSPVHAQLIGTVCIDNAASTTCPTTPPTLTGIVGENVTVSVNVQGSDNVAGLDVSVATNASILDPLSIDSSASLIHQPRLDLASTVNSGTGVARFAAAAMGYTNPAPATGNLFRVTYKVLSSSPAKIGFVPGCSGTSNDNLCVTVTGTNGITATLDPENVQIASFTGSATPDFVMTANPKSLTIRAGTSSTSTISLFSINGFAGTISLSATVSPLVKHGPTASVTIVSVTLGSGGSGSSTLKVSAGRNAPAGAYSITVTGVSGSISHTVLVTANVTPAK